MVKQGTNSGNITGLLEIGVNIMDTYCTISWTYKKGPSNATSICCRLQ